MFSKASTQLLCLLQFSGIAAAVPTEQNPMVLNKPEDVKAVRAKLHHAEIIPTVIDDFLPSLTLSVTWSDAKANLGNTVKPDYLQEEPTIVLRDEASPDEKRARPDMSYVVTLTDPDAPSRDNPEWSEMCHWIASNVSIAQNTNAILPLTEFDLNKWADSASGGPDDVMEYKPPGPPPKTGKHRYVFLVFAPKNGTTDTLHLSKPEDRQHWGTGKEGGGVREWARDNGLVPVAANFIYSKNKNQ
ncbi:phosphatidylethanolamine-binding protein [Stemphylium lycopersici]|nr:phosphatidylethanolamine-binding protein [Stemphylium lycopersici]